MTNYTDEIDLRPYILAVYKKWWQVIIIVLLCAGAAFVFSITRANKYEASALVLFTRNKAALSLAQDFPTSNEPIDFRSRIDAMLALGKSDSIYMETANDIKEKYPDIGVEQLKSSIEVSNSGDTIEVTVSDKDPEFAALVANAWARKFITTINSAYSGEQLPEEIQANLIPAKQEYNSAQADLESFLKENSIDSLEKQVAETANLLDELVQDRNWQVSYNIRRKQKMDQVINEALALREQINSENPSSAANAGTALAILRLHADAFRDEQIQRNSSSTNNPSTDPNSLSQQTVINEANSPDTVYSLQVGELIAGDGTKTTYLRDLDTIINRAKEEKQTAENTLAAVASDTAITDEDNSITTTAAKLSELQAQLENETAQFNELTSMRDLKLNAYNALAQKETEVRNNLQTSTLVTLVSPAVKPTAPGSRGLLRNTIIGGMLGFFLGIVWVVGTQWLRSLDEQELKFQKVNP